MLLILQTIVKVLISPMAFAGLGMSLMGLGFIPVDPTAAKVANIYLEPFNLPLKPFFIILGAAKVIGVISQWGYGPIPKLFARLCLMMSAACALYGHNKIGDTILPSAIMLTLLSSLFVLERLGKKKDEK
mmetsp:Transcript_36950/g.42147  ORF Transcript_36950/g.42147 Transcript_36950/m.42147 type:complete len:130 (-) Transcript_36950:152-541(-)